MTFSPEDALWIETALEAGDSPEDIAEATGIPLHAINDLLRDARHPARALSEFHRDVLSLWASGATERQIAVSLGLERGPVQSAIQFLRRRSLIWPQAPGRQPITVTTDPGYDPGHYEINWSATHTD